jgi:predicted peptidase
MIVAKPKRCWRLGATLVTLMMVAIDVYAADASWSLKQGLHLYPYESADPAKLTPHVLIFLPQGYEQRRTPLIISLHNTADAGSDVKLLKSHGLPQHLVAHPEFQFISAAPQATASYLVFDAATMNALVDDLVKRLPVDPSRVYLTGISSSAVWASRIAAETQRFAALVMISSAKPDPGVACALKGTAVWAFHNEKDPIRQVQPVKELIDAVNACQGSAKLTVYPKSGHDAWTETYSSAALYEWLAEQRR